MNSNTEPIERNINTKRDRDRSPSNGYKDPKHRKVDGTEKSEYSRDNYSSSSRDDYNYPSTRDSYSSKYYPSSRDNYSSRDDYSSKDKYSPSKSDYPPRDDYSSRDRYSSSYSSRDNYSRDNYSSSSRDNYSSRDYRYNLPSSSDNYSSKDKYSPSKSDYPPRDDYSSRDRYSSSYSSRDRDSSSYPKPYSSQSTSKPSYGPPGSIPITLSKTYEKDNNPPSQINIVNPPPTSSNDNYPSRDTTYSSSSYYPSSSTSKDNDHQSSYPSSSYRDRDSNYSSSSRYSSSSSSYRDRDDRYSSSSSSRDRDSNRDRDLYRDQEIFGKSHSFSLSDPSVMYGQSKGNASSKSDFSHLPQFKKKFYVESKSVTERSQQEINEYFKTHQVNIEGECPKPVLKFEESNLPQEMLREINRHGFSSPTPIQAVSWPAALSGRDVIGIAQTGSGKTLAFALPMIVHILAQEPLRSGDGPIGLILAPTRELAQQIEDEIHKFSTKLRVCSVFGGVPKMGQANQLRRGVEIVIACPGRLIDMIRNNKTNLKRVTFLCLDEADRMLDMGFEPQIRTIVGYIRQDRQTAMFSATWPKAVKQLASDFLTDPKGYIKINIGSQELRATHTITQLIDTCPEEQKKEKLFRLLKEVYSLDTKILIFCEKKKSTDSLAYEIRNKGFKVSALHGDKGQNERSWVLKQFSEGNCPILVATDVAARGLDVDNIKYVINYDFPNTSEDYIHRIGRTGRGGAKGTAYSFFNEKKGRLAPELISILKEAKQEVPPELYSMLKQKKPKKNFSNKGYGGYQGKGGFNNYLPNNNSNNYMPLPNSNNYQPLPNNSNYHPLPSSSNYQPLPSNNYSSYSSHYPSKPPLQSNPHPPSNLQNW